VKSPGGGTWACRLPRHADAVRQPHRILHASDGYRLAKLREEAGYTQTEVARRLTAMLSVVGAADVAEWEHDRRLWLVTRLRVEELARVLDAVIPPDAHPDRRSDLHTILTTRLDKTRRGRVTGDTFGETVNALRRAAGLTRRSLARRIPRPRVTPELVYLWERDAVNPDDYGRLLPVLLEAGLVATTG
jgi:transcriptional regulator with XRE-family HTH domain